MADKKISEFSELTTSNEAIEIIVNDAGDTKKISRATLFTGDGSNLTGISGGSGGSGEANVQANWTETTTTDDAYILNKPVVQYTSAIANATASVTGLATSTQITKLDGIEASATADQTNAEIKTAYEANADTNEFSDAEQTKLSGIAASANNYTHPSGAGDKHIPTGGSSGQFLKYSSSGTAVWAVDNDTTYSVGDGGLTQVNFTTADNTKLDGIATSANNYSHPSGDGNLHVPATSTTNNGKVLTAGSTAGALTWETASGGGGGGAMEFVSQTTVSSSTSSVEFTSLNSSSYDRYIIHIKANMQTAADLSIRFSANNGTSYDTTSNYYTLGTNTGNLVSQTAIGYGYIAYASGDTHHATLEITPSAGTIVSTCFTQRPVYPANNTMHLNSIDNTTYSTINAVKIFNNGGWNITSGVFTLYGIKDS